MSVSPVFLFLCSVSRNIFFIPVTNLKQFFFGEDILTTIFHVVILKPGQNNRIHRTSFLAQAAINTLEKINFVKRCASGAVFTWLRFNRDRQCWTNRLAQFTANAAFFAVSVTSE